MILPFVPRDTLTSIPSPATSFPQSECGFPGNNDIYGIGIRIGIYTQIIAVWFANYFLLSQVQELRDAVSVFGVAILIVSILFAANPSSVYAVEAFVLLQILAWTCMMGVRAKSSYTSAQLGTTVVRKFLNEGINLACLSLHVWFWWVGVEKMKKTPCGTYIMYVVKTDMFGWARKVMMALSVFVLLATVYWCGVEMLRPWAFLKMAKVKHEFERAVRIWEEVNRRLPAPEVSNPVVLEIEEEDAEDESQSHEGCSQYSCSRCSPVPSEFGLDRQATPVQPPKATCPLTKDNGRDPSASEHRSSCETSALSSATHQNLSPNQATNTTPNPDFAVLRHVYESQVYIQHCISSSPFQNASGNKPLTPLTVIRTIFSSPRETHEKEKGSPDGSAPSWLRCHIHIWKRFLTFRFRLQALAVYSHLRQSRLLDPLNGPFQMHASLMYKSPSSASLPPWPYISLASNLLLASPSRPPKIWLAWYYAMVDLGVHILVIAQLELTLVWNRVDGLAGLWTSVGQLISFVVGVGGLGLVAVRGTRVLYAKWRKRKYGGKQPEEGEDEIESPEKSKEGEADVFGLSWEVREGYEKWKEMYEKELGRIRCIDI